MTVKNVYLQANMEFHRLKKRIRSAIGLEKLRVAYSDNYKTIINPDRSLLKKKYNAVWQEKTIPKTQWRIVESQLQEPLNVKHFQDTVDLIKLTKLLHPSILEVGCSSGYHSEVFKKAGLKVSYTGCDYSRPFIDFARKKYPEGRFKTCDATKLSFRKQEFDLVLSGSCILHIVEYEKAIEEAARVGRKFVIFSRTPVITTTQTTFITKNAYGQEMLEVIFNETELISLFFENRMAVISTRVLSSFWVRGINEPVFVKSYLCQKL